MRLELTTSAVTGRRSNQLNYRAESRNLRPTPDISDIYPRHGRQKPMVEVIGLEPMTLCL